MRFACKRLDGCALFLLCSFLAACGSGVSSTSPVPTYTVGGTLTGLAAGNSITLTDNGTDSVILTANGPFIFAKALDNATGYNLTLAATTPTVQPCISTNGAGTINGADVTLLNVVCGQPGGKGTSTTTGLLNTARFYHTSTLLPNGKVLVSGGETSDVNALANAELYDPSTRAWTLTGSMNAGREWHTATLLLNGKVLVTGGGSSNVFGSALASAELFDPATGSWTITGSLTTARMSHTATLLANGKVLVMGGFGVNAVGNDVSFASAELYDPASGTWSSAGSLATARAFHTATLLPDGKVLVTGGVGTGTNLLASSELYDPVAGTWTTTGSLTDARWLHTSTLLPNGTVLACGGEGLTVPQLASAEIYNPVNGTWTVTGSLAAARKGHTATLLPTGEVLASGGASPSGVLSSNELYNPASGTWTATGSLTIGRMEQDASLLLNGSVLISGGFNGSDTALASSELYF
jgi:hypothetical protein